MSNSESITIKNTSINIDHNNKLDRAITFTTSLKHDNLVVAISYCKNTNNIQFKLNSYTTGDVISNSELLEFKIYRNLENSTICRRFLDLEDISNKKIDYKKKFKGVRNSSDINLINIMKEVYNFSPTNRYENNISINGWYIGKYTPKDYQFFLIERKRYDKKQNITYIRTGAIEIGYSPILFELGI